MKEEEYEREYGWDTSQHMIFITQHLQVHRFCFPSVFVLLTLLFLPIFYFFGAIVLLALFFLRCFYFLRASYSSNVFTPLTSAMLLLLLRYCSSSTLAAPPLLQPCFSNAFGCPPLSLVCCSHSSSARNRKRGINHCGSKRPIGSRTSLFH